MKRNYEDLIILDPDLSEEKVNESLKIIADFIEKNEGKVDKTENLGRREICFKKKKGKQGFFFLTNFSCSPSFIKTYNNFIKLKKEIIRNYVVVK